MWINNKRIKVTSRYSPSMPEANLSLPRQHFVVYIESNTYAKHQMHSSYIFQNNKENLWKKSSVIITKSIKWTWVSYIMYMYIYYTNNSEAKLPINQKGLYLKTEGTIYAYIFAQDAFFKCFNSIRINLHLT